MKAAEELSRTVPVARACDVLAVPRGSFYCARQEPQRRPKPARALSDEERTWVRSVLNSEAFADQSPRAVYAALLDRGKYLCHWRMMYRVLADHGEVRERRNQLEHPKHVKPELVARAPNQVWGRDISKLKGEAKWVFYYLYVILDIYRRYAVGWMVAERESEALARQLVADACTKQGITPNQFTLHADQGSPMIAQSMTELPIALGVAKSHSRPRVSNDTPYSEAQCKTLKHRPELPDRFGSVQAARASFRPLFHWYNREHYHSALGLLTPAIVHYGTAGDVLAKRHEVLSAAYAAHPERFVRGAPTVPALQEEVWINEPALTIPTHHESEGGVLQTSSSETRDAPILVEKPRAQAGSTTAEGRAQRSVDAAEHTATGAETTSTQEPVAAPQVLPGAVSRRLTHSALVPDRRQAANHRLPKTRERRSAASLGNILI